MQVISGNIRGLKLNSAKNPDLRPTKDRIKKSLFDIIRMQIQGKTFLDLFGGTGQIGIEAFSQGAKSVTIIELERENFKIIKENIKKIKVPHNITAYNQESVDFLKNSTEQYDIIFLDPPYKNTELLTKSLKEILNLKHLPDILAIETLSLQQISIDEEKFYLRKKYRYGKISLYLYEKNN